MSRRLGAIVCPMLEDELIYNLKNDPEEKRVYLVETPFLETIIPKLKQHGVEYTKITQWDFYAGRYDSDVYTVYIWVMFMGLHEDIDMLKFEVSNQIVMMKDRVDALLLYYGRCGRALDHIEEWAKGMVKIPVTLFHNRDGTLCDDCICVPLGGTDNYLRLLRTHAGKLYFTPAMAANFEGFLSSMELFNGIDTSNTEIMKILLDMAGYMTVLKVQTGHGDQLNFDENIRQFAEKYDLDVEVLEDGWATMDLADYNYTRAKDLLVRSKGVE